MSALEKIKFHDLETDPQTGSLKRALHWLNAMRGFEECKLYCQVMFGLELIPLWKAAVKNGGDRVSSSFQNLETALPTREEIVKATGLSESLLYEIMRTAREAAPRLRKLPLLKDFDPTIHPICELTPPQREAVSSAVKKLTNGKTQVQLQLELGIYKGIGRNENPTPGTRKDCVVDGVDLADPLLEIENELFSISDEKDTTFADVTSARLVKFQTTLKNCLTRVNDVLNSRRKG